MPNITVEGLRKTFDGTVAVEDVSLEIDDKKLVTLLGPSGCGKTTTLNMIAGLLSPDEGEIYIDGKQVTDLPPQERNVGMIFQDYALFTHLNVYKNIAFGLKIKKMPKQEIDREIKNVLEKCYLEMKEELRKRKDDLKRIADALLKYEILTSKDVDAVLKGEDPKKDIPQPAAKKAEAAAAEKKGKEKPEKDVGDIPLHGKPQEA